jgi:hypothetical protein
VNYSARNIFPVVQNKMPEDYCFAPGIAEIP